MKVYRIEHRDEVSEVAPFGKGPYRYPYYFQHYQQMCAIRHPCPHEEGVVGIGDHHVFGFHTLEAMYSWFTTVDAMQLQGWNFVIRVYECESVVCTHTQCVIDSRKSVQLIETAELSDIFDFSAVA